MNTYLVTQESKDMITTSIEGTQNVVEWNSSITQREATAMADGLSENTQIAYKNARAIYERAGFRFPATTDDFLNFIDYLATMERKASKDGEKAYGMAVSTIELYLAGISFYNSTQFKRTENVVNYKAVQAALKNLRCKQAKEKADKKLPAIRRAHAISTAELDRVLSEIEKAKGLNKRLRDRAIILTGYYGCLRRSEVVGIAIHNLEFCKDGLIIHIPVAKTGLNQTASIPNNTVAYEAIESLLKQLADDGITSGFLFRSVNKAGRWGESLSTVAFNNILKELAASAGLDSEFISGHSLRAGCATALFDAGVDSTRVMKHGRWVNADTVAKYYRPNGFDNNPLHCLPS